MKAQPFALPLRAPFRTAQGEVRERRGFLVRVEAHGRTGLGEAAPWEPWTESASACQAALARAQADLGAPSDPEALLRELDAACPPLARAPAARHAVSEALLDLAAQQAGEPLCALLGAEPARSVPVNATLDAEDAGPAARAAQQAGFRTLKLKLRGEPARDVARVRAVREAAPGCALRLDANAGWPRRDAEERLAQLAPFEPEYVEQPVRDVRALAELRAARIVPLAADEAAASVIDARRVLAEDAADVLVVKPMALGGLDRAQAVLAAARERDVPCVVTSLLDGAVARAGALHLAAVLPPPVPACGLATGTLLARDVARMPDVRDGRLAVPRTPGLGVELA